MFKTNIRLFLKGEVTKKSEVELKHYLAKIASERFNASGLDVDIDSEVEDAIQAFLVYLQATWYPNHRASVANRTDEELGTWVVDVFHRWLRDLIAKKRVEPPTQQLEEETTAGEAAQIQVAIPIEKEPEIRKAQEAFERFFREHEHPAIEWAKREESGKWWKIFKVIESGVRMHDSASELFERLVRAMSILSLPKAPALKDLDLCHFRSFLALNGTFSQAELSEILGIEKNTDYHARLEKEWPGFKETAQGELEVRELLEKVDPDTIREDIEKRFDNVLRDRVGLDRLSKQEVNRRMTETFDDLADPEKHEDF